MTRFNDQTALITGGAGALGSVIVRRFARDHARPVRRRLR